MKLFQEGGRKRSNKNDSDKNENDKHDGPPKKQLDSLMEHTRLKNISICKRRLPPDLSVPELVSI